MTNLFSTLQRLKADLHTHELLQPEPEYCSSEPFPTLFCLKPYVILFKDWGRRKKSCPQIQPSKSKTISSTPKVSCMLRARWNDLK